MQPVLGFLAVLAVVALLFCFLTLLARRAYIRRQRSLELHAPLLDSDDRRLDAALRDAEEGFNECPVCRFGNFRRFKFCTVCGEALGQQHADKKKMARLPLFKRESRVQLVTPTPTNAATRRRLRALRRKEWTRKVDVQGCAYWFRGGRGTDTRFTGFVVRFQCSEDGVDADVGLSLSPQRVAALEGDREAVRSEASAIIAGENDSPGASPMDNLDSTSSAGTDAPEPEPEHELVTEDNADTVAQNNIQEQEPLLGSVEECITNLVHSVKKGRAVLKTASDGTVDASKLPLQTEIGPRRAELNAPSSNVEETVTIPSTPLTETTALAGKDFPTKYAHFVTATSTLLVPAEREHLRLNVERANVFEDSMESLAIIPLRNLHSVLRINFLDESGVDAGGLHREWFVMLNEMLIDPARGLFVCTNKNEQTYFLSPCSDDGLLPDRLLHLFAAGRLFGRALLEGSMLCFHLASPFLKLILGYPLSFEDLEDLDPEVYINLRWLLENDNVDALCLDFTVTMKDGDKYHDVELVPGGSTITVTDSNKHKFVERKWQYLLVESVAPQLQVFLQGLYEIIPRELLLLFDPEEFDFLLCGSDEIDVDDWERNTKYSEDLHHHRALKWFWELVREMPNEYRRRLLQFSTGSSRVPLGGFSALTSYDGRLCPFTLKAVSLIGDGFIHSHACFNRLDLPLHVVRDELKAVLCAVLETECMKNEPSASDVEPNKLIIIFERLIAGAWMELLDEWMEAAGESNVAALATLYIANPTLLDERHPQTGRTALQHASAWDAHDAISFLLQHGAGVLVTDADGNSVLHLATASDALASLQLILHYLLQSSYLDEAWTRSLINQRNRFGYTALLIAGEEGFADCCAALIDAGADTTLPLPEMPHFTATDLSLHNNHYEVIDVLRRQAAQR